jgi:hypothetical protein
MASQFDASDFVDSDYQAARKSGTMGSTPTGPIADPGRAPTREEVESRVAEMQQRLAELKRAQQELERERAVLEETRRRQAEFTAGRQEMVQHLTRGVGLLEEAELTARRDAEQTAKALVGLREALIKVQSIHEETWTKDNLNVELARAMTAVENARMEWNAARLKFPVLNGTAATETAPIPSDETPLQELLQQRSYAELCKLGLALTWPLALAGLGIFLVLLLGR